MRTVTWGAIGLAVLLLGIRLVDGSQVAAMLSDDKPIMQWPDLLDQPRPQPDRTITYGKDALQLVDLWLPKGEGPHPVVVMIHGGCWQTEIATRDIMNYIADDLRKDGIAVWNVEYRGVDRGGGYPGTYLDVGAAADLLAAEAKALNLDLTHTIAIGHSAGGHLALWLAARQALPEGEPLRGAKPLRIDTAISQAGIADLRAAMKRTGHACGTDAPTRMAGGKFALTSPPEMPVSTAQQIQFHTDKDRIAPPAYAETYAADMKKRGVTVENHVHGPEGHVELIAPTSRSWAAQKARIKQLLGQK